MMSSEASCLQDSLKCRASKKHARAVHVRETPDGHVLIDRDNRM